MNARLRLERGQILAFRRRAGGLDERLPRGTASLRQAAWAGLQDSVPRAALLAIHARVAGAGPAAWEDPSLVQLWGPRFSVFVVAARDRAVLSLGTLPDDAAKRKRAEDLANRLEALLGGGTMTYSSAGRALGEQPNRLRYAAATGRVLVRWDGARKPTVWTVPRPEVDPRDARLELARRYLHVVGPATPEGFAGWAGIVPGRGRDAFAALGRSIVPVRTPLGEAWILARDEPAFRDEPALRDDPAFRAPALAAPTGPARLLPSGDPYLMAGDRELLVPDAGRRRELWPPSTVWPGGLLVAGELVGTWRRAGARVTIRPWRRLSPAEREEVEEEAASLPLPDIRGRIEVAWGGWPRVAAGDATVADDEGAFDDRS